MKPISFFSRILHLLAFSTIAIAQPLYDLLSSNAEFFVIRRSKNIDILILAAIIFLAYPLIASIITTISNLFSKKFGKILNSAFLLLIIELACLAILNKFFIHNPWLTIIFSLIASCLLLIAYRSSDGLRFFVSILGILSFCTPVLFLLNPEVNKIISTSDEQAFKGSTNNSKTPVFFIIFDALPVITLLKEDGVVDPERFPNFAALSVDSLFYSRISTVNAWTQTAVPAILSGKYPKENQQQLPNASEYPVNLFTIFSNSHDMNVYEQVTQLCPKNLCVTQGNSIDLKERFKSLLSDTLVIWGHVIIPESYAVDLLPSISASWGDFASKREIQVEKKINQNNRGLLNKHDWADDEYLFKQYISSINATTKPTLNFIHVTFPHVPFRYLASGKKYLQGIDRSNDAGYRKQWGWEPWPPVLQMQRHLMQLAYADKLLGEFIKKLKDAGIYDSSAIVITADHGEAFQPGEFSRRLGENNKAEVLLVPFILKTPKQLHKGVRDVRIETVDVLPTLLEALDVPIPIGIDGISAFDKDYQGRDRRMFYERIKGSIYKSEILPGTISLEQSLKRQQILFGSGPQDTLFRIGTHPELLGKDLSIIRSNLVEPSALILPNINNLSNVSISSNFIPAFIEGKIQLQPNFNDEFSVVFSLNEVIGAIVPPLEKVDGVYNIGAMLPENLFKKGHNKLEILILPEKK